MNDTLLVRLQEHLLENYPDAIFIHRENGHLEYVNFAASQLLGYNMDELTTMTPADLVLHDSESEFGRQWCELNSNGPVLLEGCLRHKAGSVIPAEIRLSRFRIGQESWIVAYCRDTSARKRADADLRVAERNRIARDLHDTLASGLTAIAVQLEAARHVAGSPEAPVSIHIAHALQLARDALREARRSVRDLRPTVLETRNLSEAIQDLVSCRSVDRPERFRCNVYGVPLRLPEVVEVHVLRIAEEALTNVLKHAQAKHVTVEIVYTDSELRLHIRDDGVGFEISQTSAECCGLLGITERAEQMAARLSLITSPDEGTSIEVTVPIRVRPEE